MNYKKNIYWLASYPKSGNTWFRIFLSNYLNEKTESVSLNEIGTGSIASSRVMFDDISALPSSELLQTEVDRLRPDIYRELSLELDGFSYNKVHDAYIEVGEEPMFPCDISAGAIYFVRNPLDVAISYANHSSIDIDKSIKLLNNDENGLSISQKKLNSQLRQYLGSWSFHVNSWTKQSKIPVMVMRYEDMLTNTYEVFKKAVEFLKLDFNKEKLINAIENSSFEKLRELEDKEGFKEKPIKAEKFFISGKSGNWKSVLNEEQISKVIDKNKDQMIEFGYLKK